MNECGINEGKNMRYKKFTIRNYRAIKTPLVVDLSRRIIPFIGVNECGKTTVLQAILCFDSANDSSNAGSHLVQTKNLYETIHKDPPQITAEIELSSKELCLVLETVHSADITDEQRDILKGYFDQYEREEESEEVFDVMIQRTLSQSDDASESYYYSDTFKKLDEAANELVCKEIVRRLPYILYNDDFNHRPASSVPIVFAQGNRSDWQAIFERVFNLTDPDFSLRGLFEQSDELIRRSMLSDVTKYLNSMLTDSWSKFSPNSQTVTTELTIDKENKTLNVYIVDKIAGKERSFLIENRSKGFIWYYNFIMKILFNPKQIGDEKGTIFLLDEPGSYLHETAQRELCKKLREISDTEGHVLYCTHSPRLLDSQFIPLSNVQIVEKTRANNIRSVSIADYKTTGKRRSAMQPIYEALQTPEYETINANEKILCVEGIYDKYTIECFCNLPKDVRLFPSTNADGIVNNIPYFIAYQKKYLALWDNDDEGRRAKGVAKKNFGIEESEHFDLLPQRSGNSNNRRMEEMIEAADHAYLRQELDLPDNATYESVIYALYDSNKRTKIVAGVSEETKGNFAKLDSIIKKRLG